MKAPAACVLSPTPWPRKTAINDSGFEVDVIRRTAKDRDPHPFRMSADENELWAVQVEGADKIRSAPRFSQLVVAETGHMAVMNTMTPVTVTPKNA